MKYQIVINGQVRIKTVDSIICGHLRDLIKDGCAVSISIDYTKVPFGMCIDVDIIGTHPSVIDECFYTQLPMIEISLLCLVSQNHKSDIESLLAVTR